MDPFFFFFWFFGVVEEGELLEDEWEGFTACCCELFGPLLFLFGILLGLIVCLLLLLVWLGSMLSSFVPLLPRGVACALDNKDWPML